MKTYSTKANARRTARHQLGEQVVEGQYFELIEINGQYGYRVTASDLVDESLANPADFGAEKPAIISGTKLVAETSKQRNKSGVSNPVQQVWAVADSMPTAKRKEIIATCVEQGIAFFTARTQYQRWKQHQQISQQ